MRFFIFFLLIISVFCLSFSIFSGERIVEFSEEIIDLLEDLSTWASSFDVCLPASVFLFICICTIEYSLSRKLFRPPRISS
ncbi:MAG: hypothetical protein AB7S78_00750 [Candidatus Omnitrophota bacterium]